jgi:hypothetical protein
VLSAVRRVTGRFRSALSLETERGNIDNFSNCHIIVRYVELKGNERKRLKPMSAAESGEFRIGGDLAIYQLGLPNLPEKTLRSAFLDGFERDPVNTGAPPLLLAIW